MRHGTRGRQADNGGQAEKGGQVEKWQKLAEKVFALFTSITNYLYGHSFGNSLFGAC